MLAKESPLANTSKIEEKIGEGLVRIGGMTREQVESVLRLQREGDKRLFGEIAVEQGFVDIQAIINYLKSTHQDHSNARSG
jgi:hypothetical protein